MPDEDDVENFEETLNIFENGFFFFETRLPKGAGPSYGDGERKGGTPTHM